MTARVGLMAVALLAGCAATGGQAPSASMSQPPASTSPVPDMASAQAQFGAQRAGLRRIGYRNCNGFDIQLYAPQRVTASGAGQALFLQARSYRATGGNVTLNVPGTASRLQRQTGAGWQDLPMRASAAGRSSGVSAAQLATGAVMSVPLVPALGQAGALPAGHYRLWLGPFSAQQAGGGACTMSPVWQFDIG
ncbi:hypothetical protein [Paracoccus tegillarcae]|uniref:Uncharacterized protein n=1 Tax=Paracoccus tegillarcae TaxID=1529068 RepID=A0A2K9ENI9_9RHOB|nr:hypothetical protein [Paracoccus tegillarcae]AUH32266.1 hypothetical protein CUV01_01610 [Paracoccus tegillarcae]